VTAFFFGGVAFLLIRRWSPGGDKQDFQQTFTFINAYSVLGIPFGLLGIAAPALSPWLIPVSFIFMAVTFARVGGGRWWRTPAGAWGKGALLMLATLLALIPTSLVLLGITVLAARYLP
jgi:hypothetical protein